MRVYTLALSICAHVIAAVAIMVMPLLATDTLPTPHRTVEYVHVTAAVLPPPPVIRARPPDAPPVLPATVPLSEPVGLAPEPELPAVEAFELPPAMVQGVAFSDTAAAAEPAPPPRPRDLVRVGGNITRPERISEVPPVYPALARQAGVEGTVILEAVIDADGSVRDLRVLRSVTLLDAAAMDAVRQWRFTPTRLNGEPVPVVMTVTVTFRLR